MNKQRKTSNILNVFQYDEATGIIGLNGVPVSGYGLYLHTNINDGSVGIDSSSSINALYLLKSGTKQFEISYDTSGVDKIFRLLPYQSGSFFQIGNPSNAGANYVFISEPTYGNVLIGPGIGNGTGNLTGATAATHKIQFNGAVFANSSIQATSFKITGGAGTGFLKADGTVDTVSYLSGNQTITVSGDASGSGTTSINLTLANTAVTPGTYGSSTLVPVVTVDSKGRITNVSTASISGALTFTGDVTGTGTTGSSTSLTLANSGVTAGTYTKVTVDSKGRVTVGANATTSDISEGTNLYYTDARVLSYLGANNYATQSYVTTQINNLVAGAPGLLDTLDELAAALGDDANFATTTATSLGNRLRVDIGTQGLNSTQQGYGRTNLGLGSLATLSSIGNSYITDLAWSKLSSTPTTISGYGITNAYTDAQIQNFFNGANAISGYNKTNWDTAYGWGNHASAGYLTTSSAASTYASLTGSYANPSWITSLAYSKLTGVPAFLTSYTETDTLATVTARGATTSTNVTFNGLLNFAAVGNVSFTSNDASSYPRFTGNYSSAQIGLFRAGSAVGGMYIGGTGTGFYVFDSSFNIRLLINQNGDTAFNSSTVTVGGNQVWHAGNLTNLNQLTNGPGYITGYSETDTLATVTARGASTSTLSNFNAGLTSAKTSKTAYGIQVKGGFYGAPRIQLYDLAVDGNAYLGLGTDMSGGAYEFSNYFPRYSGYGRWSVGSWAGDFGTGQYVSGYNEKFWITESAAALNVPITVNGRITSTSNLGLYVNSGGASYIGINSTSSWAYTSLLNNGTTTWDLGAFNGGSFEFRPYGGDNNRIIVGLNGVMYFTDTTNGIYKSGGRFTVRSESTDNVANFASYGLYLPQTSQTAGLYVESPIEARGGLRIGSGAVNGTITVGATTGATADRLVQRDSAGDIYSRYSFAVHFNQSGGNSENPTIGQIWTQNTTDNYVRKSTPAHFISQLSLITVSNYSSYSLPLSGGVMTGALVNNVDGAVIIESNATENNNWLWKENSKAWGLFWFNRGSQAGQTIGGYTTVGAELMFMGGSNGIAMPSGWTGYYSGSYIAAMISNYNGYIYSASTVFAASDMRAPIFYDSNDTGYYLDPNGVSNLSAIRIPNTDSYATIMAGLNNSSRIYADGNRKAIVINADYYPALYLNAFNGNNTTHGAYIVMSGTLSAGGFRQWTMGIANYDPGIFSIGYNDNMAGNGHYGTGDNWSGSDAHHGRLIVDTSGNTKIRGMLYVNGTSGGMTTGNAVIHAGNIGSQSVSNSSSLGGYGSSTYVGKFGNGNGYYQADNWIQMNTSAGMFWPSYNGAHIYPNTATSYGSMRIDGTRNSWRGLNFGGSVTLMMNDNETGHYKDGYGWQWRWYQGSMFVSRGTYGGSTEYTVIDSGTIGSQSVSNATTIAGVGVSTIRGGISSNNYDFYVNGDANTYYPVVLSLGGQYGMHRYSISRGYSDPAPWDPIGTGSHRGGLTLTFDCSSDIAWGGNDKSWRIIQFSEQYTNMVAGMALPVTDGIIVWLRGGGAYYRFHGPSGINHSATVYYSGYSAANGAVYYTRTNLNNVDSEIRAKWPIRGYGDGAMYVANNEVLHLGNYISYMDKLYYQGSQRLWTGSDGTRNSGWAYHQDNNTGIHWPNNGWHFYPKDASDMYVRAGSGSNVSLVMNTAGTNRGYVYADSSNQIGFLNNDRNWIFRMTSGGDAYAVSYYSSASTSKYLTSNTSSYTTWYVGGNNNGYSGFRVDGGMCLMMHTNGASGPTGFWLNNWSILTYVDSAQYLYHNGNEKFRTDGGGIYVTGTVYATGDVIAYYSDARLKKDVVTIDNAISKIKQLRGVTYTWNDEKVNVAKERAGTKDIGLIAQEVEAVEPLFITEYQSQLNTPSNDPEEAKNFVPEMSETYKTIKYEKLVALLVEGMKEQQKQIEELQNKLDNVLSSR